jgi:hypothetical protein
VRRFGRGGGKKTHLEVRPSTAAPLRPAALSSPALPPAMRSAPATCCTGSQHRRVRIRFPWGARGKSVRHLPAVLSPLLDSEPPNRSKGRLGRRITHRPLFSISSLLISTSLNLPLNSFSLARKDSNSRCMCVIVVVWSRRAEVYLVCKTRRKEGQ